MAPPTYFFPRINAGQLVQDDRLLEAILRPRGLLRTFADIRSVREQCSVEDLIIAGPGEASGVLLTALPADGTKPTRIGYCREAQTWTQQAAGEAEYWVGVDREYPPGPADLARARQIGGYEVTLGEATWTVPVIRDPHGATGLPSRWELAADGGVSEIIRDEYRALWDDFAGTVDLFFSADHPSPPYVFELERAEAMRLCLAALAINYRYGRAEQNLLGLIDSETWTGILAATVDYQTFRDLYELTQKKKQQRLAEEAKHESSDTSTGEPDGSPTIDPAEAS